MFLTVSLDLTMTHDVEALAAKTEMTLAEYVIRVVAEAIEDVRDYDRCADSIDGYEQNPVLYNHNEVIGSSNRVDLQIHHIVEAPKNRHRPVM